MTGTHEGSPPSEAPQRFVVGIGASAGGLEAVGELVRNLAPAGMTYVVVQHLAPDHESVLTQLLARGAQLQIVTATDGMVLEPDRVHVIPPNADLTIADGIVQLVRPASPRSPHLPIDELFRSIAADSGPLAIGVVMSGTGSDGTVGLQAIKAAGGLTFVQEPGTARYDGMPRNALATGAPDYCLSPKEIAAELGRISKRPESRASSPVEPPQVVEDQLARLFVLIRSELGNDLTQYKPATIDRRIDRRMLLHKLDRLEDYVKLVHDDREELRALCKDIFISVTSFFRDPEAFEALATKIFPQLLEKKDPQRQIRIWVPACATGEEAYSIAMILLEVCEQQGRSDPVQIFGTDIDEDAIQHARRGVYPASISHDVSPERLRRFFVPRDAEYQITRRVRDMLVFSRQNVLKDAPLSRLDLVSCRNLLIYLQPGAQKRVLRILHYALNPSGHLLLGTSETVGDAPELFSAVDRKNKIYAKKLLTHSAPLELGLGAPAPVEPAPPPKTSRPPASLQQLADRKVLELYGPPGVVVTEALDIVQFRGHTGPHLDPAPGAASLNILKVARFELHQELKRALHRARTEDLRITGDVELREEGKPCVVRIDVVPLHERDAKTRHFLVMFHRLPVPTETPAHEAEQGATDGSLLPLTRRIEELERELSMTKDYLQATAEEKESMVGELKTTNEELQTSNEELQSTNEELETSREEMQSTNEELTTLNDELQTRMSELSQTNDDLHNVLTGVDNAVVIVGMDLRVRRYTTAAEKLLNLVPADVGRTIGVLDAFLGSSGGIEAKVSRVVHSLATYEEEILASNRRWYSLRIHPYKTLDHSIRGALVMLGDIDVRRRAADMTRDVGAYASRFLGAIEHPLLILDRKLRIVWANDAFLSTFQLSSEEILGSALASVGTRQLADPELREKLESVFASELLVRGHRLRIDAPGGVERTARVGASLIPASTEMPLALLSIELTEGATRRQP